jgi:transcriptional regulator with XRE-family HTH domain
MVTTITTPFGTMLRDWRTNRGKTQLTLAIDAQTTSRHVSFLETGRSRPTETMVLRLSDALDVPLRDRNKLLAAAGLAPAYAHEPLSEDRYGPARDAIDRLLSAHEPFPAMVLDAGHDVLAANGGSERLLGRDITGENMLDAYLSGNTPPIANWEDVAGSLIPQIRSTLARTPDDERLRTALAMAEAAGGRGSARPAALVSCPWFEIDGHTIKTLILAARFDHPLDVTIEELRIELVFPIDDESRAFFFA